MWCSDHTHHNVLIIHIPHTSQWLSALLSASIITLRAALFSGSRPIRHLLPSSPPSWWSPSLTSPLRIISVLDITPDIIMLPSLTSHEMIINPRPWPHLWNKHIPILDLTFEIMIPVLDLTSAVLSSTLISCKDQIRRTDASPTTRRNSSIKRDSYQRKVFVVVCLFCFVLLCWFVLGLLLFFFKYFSRFTKILLCFLVVVVLLLLLSKLECRGLEESEEGVSY